MATETMGFSGTRYQNKLIKLSKYTQSVSCILLPQLNPIALTLTYYKGGSSNNHCSDVYHGSNPWSEVETASVRDYILQRRGEWIFYDSIHAYGNMILFPYGYTHAQPPDYDYMVTVANIGANALRNVNGNSYVVGSFYNFSINIHYKSTCSLLNNKKCKCSSR